MANKQRRVVVRKPRPGKGIKGPKADKVILDEAPEHIAVVYGDTVHSPEPLQLRVSLSFFRPLGKSHGDYAQVTIEDAASGLRILDFTLDPQQFITLMSSTRDGSVPGRLFTSGLPALGHEYEYDTVEMTGISKDWKNRVAFAEAWLAKDGRWEQGWRPGGYTMTRTQPNRDQPDHIHIHRYIKRSPA